VIILAYYYPPMVASGAVRPARFTRFLPRYGFDCRVVAGHDGASASRLADTCYLDSAALSGPASRLCRLIQRYLLPYNERLEWAPPAVAAARRWAESPAGTVVLSTSPPLGCHLAGWWLKRRHGFRWVADFRDPLSDNSSRQRRFSYDRWLERRLVRDADAVIVNTDAVARLWHDRYPQYAGKIHLLWNGFDPQPAPAAAAPVGGRKEIAHVGNLYGDRHPGLFLDAMARLLRDGRLPAACWQVSLVGALEPGCFRECQPAVDFLSAAGCLSADGRSVPREQAIRRVQQSSYLLLLDLQEVNAGLQVPAKIFEYIQAGRPILAWTRPASPTARILALSGVPHQIFDPREEPQATDRKLAAFLAACPEPAPPQSEFLETFDGERQVARLADILRRVCSPGGPGGAP
jgi:hypothetical protein